MALEPVANTPGLWRDTQWQAGMPGLYALLAGVSAYPHLEGGSAPAPDAFGLGQLGASANTAASLFDWLRADFRRDGLPLVWCQLLLAPTDEEKAGFDQRGLVHYAPADHATLVKAIQRWTGQLPSAPAAARQSRTLFFFSGHGVQSNWRALLLPSDYLDPDPGAPQLQNCVSTRELQDWMEQSPVAEHLALIDACRNEFSPLASRGATANTCFPLLQAGTQVPRTAASLAATSPGTQAYQVPGQPHTLFGQALLNAVRGDGGTDARLEFRELVEAVRKDVNALLKAASQGQLEQAVRPRVEGDDALVVTELLAGPVPPPPVPTPGALPRVGGGRPRPDALTEALRASAERFDPRLAVGDAIPLEAMVQDFGEIHRRMGHEYTSHLWREGVHAFGLDDGLPLTAGLLLLAVERDDPSSQVQVDLELPARTGGVLLVFEGVQYVQRERLAVALPTDASGPVPIRLSLQFGPGMPGEPPRLLKLQARLGPSAHNPHYQYLWTLLREAELGSARKAAERIDPERLRAAAQDQPNGQAALTAGMLLQASTGHIEELQAWPRSLLQRAPDLPDAAVLWAASLRHALEHGKKKPFGEAAPQAAFVAALASLQTRGLPYFVDSLELAERLLRQALRGPLQAGQGEQLRGVQQAIAQLFEVAQPDGQFPVLAGLPRPAQLPGDGPLTVAELRAVLGRR
ncbi:caspase family protein [Pseudorhodoferax soli]|uniref:Caspase domain-containing protein n=1 Tax=Pseudorhodoferax soli TaxID=545864 RepID=A0A368XQA8_9BURK|nr:caspase family protein [Pseudorhodoferax soli]RCW70161.1 caspase domain-containing protein [Pseudorhodoferax soli]